MWQQIPLIEEKEISKEKVKEKAKEKKPAAIKRLDIELIEEEEVVPVKISREPAGSSPVIPTHDGCCIGVCTNMNKEIDVIGQAIKIRQDELKFLGRGETRMKTRRQITALTNKISALKDMRFTFKEKGVCKCIEEAPKP